MIQAFVYRESVRLAALREEIWAQELQNEKL
jgi:hypothetical protein